MLDLNRSLIHYFRYTKICFNTQCFINFSSFCLEASKIKALKLKEDRFRGLG